jgi:hypothetical protein
MMIDIFLIIITFFIGIIILATVVKKPYLFWPILIAISVGTGGLLIGGYLIGGYFWVDEFLLGCLLVGTCVSVLIKRTNLYGKRRNLTEKLHLWIFYIFIFYMVFQTIRGFFIWQEDLIKIVRWIIFYLMLGVLAFLLSRNPFSHFSKRSAVLIIFISAFLYLLSYLMHGTLSGLLRGINWLSLQGFEWSGSAYATFPLLIASVAAVFLVKEKKLYYILLGVALFALGIIVSVYYSSRVSLLVVLFFIVLLLFISKISLKKKVAILFFFFFIASTLIWQTAPKEIKNYYVVLFQGEKKYEIWKRQGGDIDRYMHFRASLDAVRTDWKTLLFGYGIYGHRSILVPYLQELSNRYRNGAIVEGPIRTTGFSALIVDAGWVGILLFAANFLLLGWQILYKNKNSEKFILVSAVSISFLWMLVSNIQDLVLLYFLIMPFGLIFQLNKTEEKEINVIEIPPEI